MSFGKHVFQLPPNPKGLVVFLPGCARGAYGFWPQSSNSRFLGFPEDVSHTKQILKKGYGLLVLTPGTTTGSLAYCWTSTVGDDKTAPQAIAEFRKRYGLENKPLYLMGASSGGGMAQRLLGSGAVKANGMIAEVSTKSAEPTTKSPMTVWIAMSRKEEQTAAADLAKRLNRLGTKAASIVSPKKRITPEFFAEQMAFITPQRSAELTNALRNLGYIDKSGNLVKDPKADPAWSTKLPRMLPWMKSSPLFATATVRSSPIYQALLNAYSGHEHTAMYTTAILTWFESNGRKNLQELANELVVTKPAYFSAV